MPRYRFHCPDHVRQAEGDGIELPDDQAARLMGVAYTGEVLKHDPTTLCDTGTWRVEVTDGNGRLLWTVVTTAMDPPRPKPRLSVV